MFKVIEKELAILENKFVEYLLTPNKATNQILEHVFSSGGKRIRPALFLLCCNAINYHGEHKYPIASVCEYIHTASLLHDDVIDNSTLRRNKPTVNSVWGDETAVLSGDLIYSAACRIMVKTRHLDLIDCFAECIRFMSESELFQLEMLWNKDVTFEQYQRIVHGKTAYLFEASCKTSAYLNSNSQEIVHELSEFGKNLGFAFQMKDDCLDYEGQLEVVGKPVGCDLLEGKVTLPLIFALKKNHAELNSLVSKILETGHATEDEKRNLIVLVHELGGLQEASKLTESFIQKALSSLNKIEELIKEGKNEISELQKQSFVTLKELTNFVMKRKI